MDHTAGGYREIAVPVSVFAALRRELAKGAGPLPTIHALYAAGFAAGEEASSVFAGSTDEDVGALPEDAFWSRLVAFFSRRGWGTLSREGDSLAVGMLASPDWAESADAPPEGDENASCSFSTGFLAGLLTRLAGGRVAVLEVTCRSRGDDRCTFAFGSESAIHELYGQLLDGARLEEALSSL